MLYHYSQPLQLSQPHQEEIGKVNFQSSMMVFSHRLVNVVSVVGACGGGGGCCNCHYYHYQ